MKIGLSCSALTLNEENLASMKKSGIDCLEVGIAYGWCKLVDYKAIEKNAREAGVELWSSHLPFCGTPLINAASPDKAVRDATVSLYSDLIPRLSDIGVKKFIVHPSGEPIPDDERGERINYAKETLSRLAEIAAREGGVICVEDLPRSCLGHTAEEIKEIISADERLRVVFDTNHLLLQSNEYFIEKLADKIVTLHVSDFDFVNERHWLPGEGKLCWKAIYDKLCEAGYTGPWLYEVNFVSKTIIRDRALIYSDFYENAQTIFSGKAPEMPAFSRHKEVLGMWE